MDYSSMTLAQLRGQAKEKGLKGISALKKMDLIALLQAQDQEKSTVPNEMIKKENTEKQDDSRERIEEVARRLAISRENKEETPRRQVNSRENEEEAPRRQVNSRENEEEAPRRQVNSRENEEETPRRPVTPRESFEENTDNQDNERRSNQPVKTSGILEIVEGGFGFIRCENYLSGDKDVYVSHSQIRKFNLKTGDILCGNTKFNSPNDKFAALIYIDSVNGYKPYEAQKRSNFEDLTPIFPNERIRLEIPNGPVSMRMLDLLSPIGKGQRGMIVSQPKTGKTTLLKQIAKSIIQTEPKMKVIVLLIDERPEEVTDIRESIEGENAEVIYSTFDELPEHHRRVSEMVLERAKRLVEHKEDVVILLDSITRLARAYNLLVPPSGRTLSGGLDPAALHMPKKFFGAARNMREGGSLTILATALVDTGSKMDDVVFEEFKGTGNMEVVLDRKLSEKRIFPAINIQKSGTRREDLLLSREEQEIGYALHREMSGAHSEENMEQILRIFKKSRTNKEFISTMQQSLLKKKM